MHTIRYIKQIINRGLLYRTWNLIEYSVITYRGKESEKEWVYVYV